jgi:hypothetical protein
MLNQHFPKGFLVSLGHRLGFGVYINQPTFHLWGSPPCRIFPASPGSLGKICPALRFCQKKWDHLGIRKIIQARDDLCYHLVMTNSLPWYRWPIEIDGLPNWIMVDLSMAMLSNQRVDHIPLKEICLRNLLKIQLETLEAFPVSQFFRDPFEVADRLQELRLSRQCRWALAIHTIQTRSLVKGCPMTSSNVPSWENLQKCRL